MQCDNPNVKYVEYVALNNTFTVWWHDREEPTSNHKRINLHTIIPRWLLDQAVAGTKEGQYEVIAVKFDAKIGRFSLRWAGHEGIATHGHKRPDLTNIDQDILNKAQFFGRIGKWYRMVGARNDSDDSKLTPVMALSPSGPRFGSYSLVGLKSLFQATNMYCSINCVANTGGLTEAMYDLIKKEIGPSGLFSLKEVGVILAKTKGSPGRLQKVKMHSRQALLPHIMNQKGAAFCCEVNDTHCITIDTRQESNVILDTDPKFPLPIELTLKNLEILKIYKFNAAYKWVPRPVTKKLLRQLRKRKREELKCCTY